MILQVTNFIALKVSTSVVFWSESEKVRTKKTPNIDTFSVVLVRQIDNLISH